MADITTNVGALIPINDNNGKRAVSARDLHTFLESKQQFADWIKNRITKYDLVENVDYVVFHNSMKNLEGGRPQIEYALTIDAAKELSMVEGNERGKQARKYFIACEQKLKELQPKQYQLPQTYLEALKALVVAEEEKQQLALENKVMKPKAEYFDNLVDRNLLTNIRDTAKQIHIPQNKFVSLLLENKFVYRDAKRKLKPYAEYIPLYFEMKDFERNGHADTQLLINPKGKETFRLMWGGMLYEG